MNSHDHDPLDAEERELARQLRQLGPRGEPSAALDARILSAAHAELSAHPPVAAKRRQRWLPTLGLAASLVLAIGVVWQIRPSPPDTAQPPASFAPAQSAPVETPAAVEAEQARNSASSAIATDATTAAGATPQPAAPKPIPAPLAARSQAPNEPQPRLQEVPAYEPPLLTPASPPSPPLEISAVAAPAAPAAVANGVMDFSMKGDKAATPPPQAPAIEQRAHAYEAYSAQRMTKPAPAPAVAETHKSSTTDAVAAIENRDSVKMDRLAEEKQVAAEDARLPRQEWLQRIRERRQDGDEDGARASLERFVQAHPHSAIPRDLRSLLQDR